MNPVLVRSAVAVERRLPGGYRGRDPEVSVRVSREAGVSGGDCAVARTPCASDRPGRAPAEDATVLEVRMRSPAHPRPALTELSATVARALESGGDPAVPDAIIVCQTSIDCDYMANASSALRLQCDYGLTRNAFSVGSQDGAAFFTALLLARDLMAGDPQVSKVLVCCAESWPESDRAQTGVLPPLGDGAAAVLLGNEGAGWRLLAVDTHWQPGSAEAAADPARAANHLAEGACHAIARALVQAGLGAGDIDRAVAPNCGDGHLRAVARLTGLSVDCRGRDVPAAYFCAADPAERLHAALDAGPAPREGERLLVWGIGLSGNFGAAVFEYMP